MKFIDGLVVSPPENSFIVHSLPDNMPWLPVNDFASGDGFDKIKSALTHFDPDIFYVFNFQTWPALISRIRKSFPGKKIIYDIQTPLLADGEKRKNIQAQGRKAADHLDAIATLSRDSVYTWIPDLKSRFMNIHWALI
ncbi:MAG: hypothetical protein R2874_12315 [Desulfobacterales bacterium]